MKKTLLLLVTTLLLFTACASNDNPKVPIEKKHKTDKEREMDGLKEALNDYTKATKENNVSALLSFVYPKVFTLVPKAKMSMMLTKMFASGKGPDIKEIKNTNFTPIQKYDAGEFSIITSLMTMELKSPREEPEFEEFMLKMLKKQLSEKSKVVHNKEKHTFLISNESKVIGIKENDGWKFVGYTQAKKYASKNILPKAITDSLTVH